jgi:hypothetical protein
MNKTEQLDQLFEKWQKDIPSYKGKFVKDGIIKEEIYSVLTKPKLLFIAKEPNNPKQEEGDFRKWWCDTDPQYSFSYRIAEWAHGILNDFPPFDDIYDGGYPVKYKEALSSIAFMNIKKIGGLGNSNYTEMMKHLKDNKELLMESIEIISPDIIITCFTWPELRNELFSNLKWEKSGYAIDIAKWKNTKIIDFYHPSSRNAPAAAYSLLQNVIQSDKFKKLLQS